MGRAVGSKRTTSAGRRWFLGTAGAGVAAVALWPARRKWAEPKRSDPGRELGVAARLSPPTEPGERFDIRGRVLAPDGKTPASGVIVYAYNTDIRGLYAATAGQAPRIRGWMRTDANGRFHATTIRPGAYPSGSTPAHVHFQLWGGGHPAQWSSTMLFDGDPMVASREIEKSRSEGRFGFVRPVIRDRDGWRASIELRLKPRGDRFERSIRHGIDEYVKRFGPVDD